MVKEMVETQTEQKILDAARSIFLSQGYAGARMQDIADAAGINKAMLHYYFRNKDKLFETIFREAIGNFLPRVNEVFHSDIPYSKKIEGFVTAYLNMVLDKPYIPLFVLTEMNRNMTMIESIMFNGPHKPPFDKFILDTKEAVKSKQIRQIEPIQLLLHILSMCVFPFIARPMMQKIANVSDANYQKLLKQRKTEVVSFILHSLKP
jgi:TetR/AcrR family transcriptional regulator